MDVGLLSYLKSKVDTIRSVRLAARHRQKVQTPRDGLQGRLLVQVVQRPGVRLEHNQSDVVEVLTHFHRRTHDPPKKRSDQFQVINTRRLKLTNTAGYVDQQNDVQHTVTCTASGTNI